MKTHIVSLLLAAASTLALSACGEASGSIAVGDRPASPDADAPSASDGDAAQAHAPPVQEDAPSPTSVPPAAAAPPMMLYTVSGTNETPQAGFAAEIGRRMDPSLVTWEPVGYPGAAFPMDASIDQGVTALVSQIEAHPGKFALTGFSQGAAVTSKVYDLLRYGSLQHRRQDFITGVALGNIMRQAGHTIPGGTDPGGHGILAERLSDCESLWWDFCAPNDIACTIGDDLVGRDYTAVFAILMRSFTGQADVLSLVLSSIKNPLEIFQQIAVLTQVTTRLMGLLSGTDGHGTYLVNQPIQGNSLTSVELAVEHLHDVARSQAPAN